MTELGLVLLALYLIEGLGWIHMRGAAISRLPWSGFLARAPHKVRSEGQRGLLLPEPWIPAFERYVIHPWPLALSPDGGVAPEEMDSRDATGKRHARTIDWKDIGATQVVGAKLKFGDLIVDAGSPRNATHFAALLQRLAQSPPAEREAAILKALAASLDERRALKRARIMRVLLRDARPLALATTVNMLLFGPVLTQFFGSARVWRPWLLLHLVLTVLTVVFVWTATRRKPRLAPDDRFQTLFILALYPPAAARFVEKLFPNAFVGLDPLTVQAVLLSRKRLVRAAGERIRALHPSTGDHEIRRWFRDRVRHEVDALIDRQGLRREPSWSTSPRETGAVAYCPRCHTQYRADTEYCADCTGVALIPHVED